MMLTPKDQRTVLAALASAAFNTRQSTVFCQHCRDASCETCQRLWEKAVEYDTLADRLRSEP